MSLDKEKLHARISEIKESVDNVRRIAAMPDDELFSDFRNISALKYQLTVALEAAGSICVHVCSRELNAAVTEYAECFDRLRKSGLLTPALSAELSKVARFRNLLIHRYWEVDDKKVVEYARSELGVFDEYIKAIGALVV